MIDKAILWPELEDELDEFIEEAGYENQPLAIFQCPLCLSTHMCVLMSAQSVYRSRSRATKYFYCIGQHCDAFETLNQAKLVLGMTEEDERRMGCFGTFHKIVKMNEATILDNKITEYSI